MVGFGCCGGDKDFGGDKEKPLGRATGSSVKGLYNPSIKGGMVGPGGLSFGGGETLKEGGGMASSSSNDNDGEWCCLAMVEFKLNYEITNMPSRDELYDPVVVGQTGGGHVLVEFRDVNWPDEICYEGTIELTSESECLIDKVKCKGTTRYGPLWLKYTSCDSEWKGMNKLASYHSWWGKKGYSIGWLKLPCCLPVEDIFDENDPRPKKDTCETKGTHEVRHVKGCIKALPGYWDRRYLYNISANAAKEIMRNVCDTHWIGGTDSMKVKLCCSDEYTTDYVIPPIIR